MDDTSCLFYVTGYYGKSAREPATAHGLLLNPIVSNSPSGCVEMLFVAKASQTESEWETWFKSQDIANNFFAQMSLLVKLGIDGEGCVNRFIDTQATMINADVMDAYRIASNGKMHFMDGRKWAMTRQDYDAMCHEAVQVQNRIQNAWQDHLQLENEIEMIRDVLIVLDRLAPFNTRMVLESGAPIYAISDNTMLLHFMPLFDWNDVQILEDKMVEIITEIDELNRKHIQLSIVLERQKMLIGIPERKKRHRLCQST